MLNMSINLAILIFKFRSENSFMVNTKLITVLKTLSKSEIIRFRELVNSPYFNKNQNVMKLLEEVIFYYPDFDSEEFNEEHIFRKMFGKEKYNYFKIKNIISDLYQLSVIFLRMISLEKRGVKNDIDLLNELHERKLDNIYQQKEKQISRHFSSQKVKDEFYYESHYQLARANTSHFKFIKSGYSFDLMQKEFDIYVQYTLIVLLRNYAKMLTNKNHGNIQFDMKMFLQVLDYVSDMDFEDNPSCRIYKQIITLEMSRDEKDYRVLLRLKDKYSDKLSVEDIYYILLVANSFAAYRLKAGDESYYKDRFNTVREMNDRKIQIPEYILYVNFINSYTAACMVNEYDWAEDFLVRFQNGISPEDEKINTINYCRAFRAYRLKEYDKALEYFSKINFKLFLMKVMVKSYTVRIYYERNMHEQTFSAIDAFRHYLKSEKLISEEQKTAHYDFLRFVSGLTKLKSEGVKGKNKKELNLLKKQIREMISNPLGTKNWLIAKSENFNA